VQDYYLRAEYRIKSIPVYIMSLNLISNLIDFQQSVCLNNQNLLARNVIIPSQIKKIVKDTKPKIILGN